MNVFQALRGTLGSFFSSTTTWTQDETVALFESMQNCKFDSKRFNRSLQDCSDHWADVISMAFLDQGNKPLPESIKNSVAEFHQQPSPFNQFEAERMVMKFLIDKEPLKSTERARYFQQLIMMIAKKRGLSVDELISSAIETYFQYRSGSKEKLE
jgi:hypothetical protein